MGKQVMSGVGTGVKGHLHSPTDDPFATRLITGTPFSMCMPQKSRDRQLWRTLEGGFSFSLPRHEFSMALEYGSLWRRINFTNNQKVGRAATFASFHFSFLRLVESRQYNAYYRLRV